MHGNDPRQAVAGGFELKVTPSIHIRLEHWQN
jgi:hypothetical protein